MTKSKRSAESSLNGQKPGEGPSSQSRPKKKVRRKPKITNSARAAQLSGADTGERELEFHEACRALRVLSPAEFSSLEQQIVNSDNSINLMQRIVIDSEGRIVDGRHRARIILKVGHGDELFRQIDARGGTWIEVLPEDQDPSEYAFLAQIGRRNCPHWQIMMPLLVAEESLKAKSSLTQEDHQQLKKITAFRKSAAKKLDISKSRLSEIRCVAKHATTQEVESLQAGEESFQKLHDACKLRSQGESSARHSSTKRNPNSGTNPEASQPQAQQSKRIARFVKEAKYLLSGDNPEVQQETLEKLKAALPMDVIQTLGIYIFR